MSSTRTGARLFNTQTDKAIKDYNLFNYLEYASRDGKNSAEAIQAAMDSGLSGVTVYTKDGYQEYISYTPLENGKWTLLLFVGRGYHRGKHEPFFQECIFYMRGNCVSTYPHKRIYIFQA